MTPNEMGAQINFDITNTCHIDGLDYSMHLSISFQRLECAYNLFLLAISVGSTPLIYPLLLLFGVT